MKYPISQSTPSQLLLLLFFASVLTGCEYEFTQKHELANETSEVLHLIFSEGTHQQDTITIAPGTTSTVEILIDPTARVPEAISCLPNRRLDTMIHASGRRVILAYDVESNWKVVDFEANASQTCLFTLDDQGLE